MPPPIEMPRFHQAQRSMSITRRSQTVTGACCLAGRSSYFVSAPAKPITFSYSALRAFPRSVPASPPRPEKAGRRYSILVTNEPWMVLWYCQWRIRLVAQDAALSRRRSRVRVPYAPPPPTISRTTTRIGERGVSCGKHRPRPAAESSHTDRAILSGQLQPHPGKFSSLTSSTFISRAGTMAISARKPDIMKSKPVPIKARPTIHTPLTPVHRRI